MYELDTDNAHIAYWDEGEGEPVLLVHASLSADWFAPIATRLPGHRVLRLHRAGYGRSIDRTGVGIADHAEHLALLLRERGIDRAHLVGHSSGATIALQLALAHPDLVHSLVLLEPAAPRSPEEPPTAMPASIRAAAEGRYAEGFDLFLGSVCLPGYRDALARQLGPDGLAAAVASSRYFFDHEHPAMRAWTIGHADLAAVTQPALLVDGEAPGLTSPFAVRNAALAAALPNATRTTLPGVSHALPVENPDLVARTITDFLAAHPLD